MLITREARKMLSYLNANFVKTNDEQSAMNLTDFYKSYSIQTGLKKSEVANCIFYLNNEGYILMLTKGDSKFKEMFDLTYKGIHYKSFIAWDVFNSAVTNILLPIVVSIATTIIALYIAGTLEQKASSMTNNEQTSAIIRLVDTEALRSLLPARIPFDESFIIEKLSSSA